MKKQFLYSMLLLILFPSLVSSSDGSDNAFGGVWENIDSQTRGITKILINADYQNAIVNVIAKCSPVDCNWGTVQGEIINENTIKVTYEEDFKKVMINMVLDTEKSMTVETNTQYYRTGETTDDIFYLNRDESASSTPIGIAIK